MKKADSPYVTNSRGADWIKVKPEYADQMGEVCSCPCNNANTQNLDLLVLGGSPLLFLFLWQGDGGAKAAVLGKFLVSFVD